MSFHKSEDGVLALVTLVAAAGSSTPVVAAAAHFELLKIERSLSLA
jgi:hypothetical protein